MGRNPINNLGDYNKVRIDLQNAGGNRDVLYKKIGETFVAREAPKLITIGAVGATVVLTGCAGLVLLGTKISSSLKSRKDKLKNEPELKKEFEKALENEIIENIDRNNDYNAT